MKSLKNKLLMLWNDESGQGATEYILLLVVVVGLAMLFKNEIRDMLTNKLQALKGEVGSFSSGP